VRLNPRFAPNYSKHSMDLKPGKPLKREWITGQADGRAAPATNMAREPRMVDAMFTMDAMFMILRKALHN
jgi:hypothetical protein